MNPFNQKRKRTYYLFIHLTVVFFLIPEKITCQHLFSVGYGPLKIIRHSPKSTYPIPSVSQYIQLGYARQTTGNTHWERYWNRPRTGMDLVFLQLDRQHILGRAVGIMPSVSFRIMNSKDALLAFKLATGLAYVDRPYNKISNPLNNAIGSHLNNMTQFQLHGEKKITQKLTAVLELQFTHISNSKTASPNLGINMAGIQGGIQYAIQPQVSVKPVILDSITIRKRNGLDLTAGYGISEYSFSGGPVYNCYLISAGWYHHFSPFISLITGGSYEYNQSVYQFYYQDFVEPSTAHQLATKWSGFTALQLRFDKLALRLYTGLYLPIQANREPVSPHYFMLQLQYFPLSRQSKLSPFVGVSMKAHAQIAQYAALATGFQW
jgi:hypothetical protein